MESFYVSTPIGCLQVFCSQNKVTELSLGIDEKKGIDDKKSSLTHLNSSNKSMSSFALNVKSQIERYFLNAYSGFDVEFDVTGTAFQQAVWAAISSIKVGETLTYTDIANLLNSSPRAVGNACRCNPVPIFVPCHRVVSKSGIGGFAGQREGNNIDVKCWLLEHERLAAASKVA